MKREEGSLMHALGVHLTALHGTELNSSELVYMDFFFEKTQNVEKVVVFEITRKSRNETKPG